MTIRNDLLRVARDRLGRHAHTRALVIGDSHTRVFHHWLFPLAMPRVYFDVEYVPGATALGILNEGSHSGAHRRFVRALEERPHDLVLLNVGEVDTAYSLWRRAERGGRPVGASLDLAIANYCTFIDRVRAAHRLVVLSATLPTLPDQGINPDPSVAVRAEVKASQHERTALTLELNRRVRAHCRTSGVEYLSADAIALAPDGLVRRDWLNARYDDHHYALRPYARWLIGALRPVLG